MLSIIHFPEFGGPHNQSLRLGAPLANAGIESISVLPGGQGAERLRAGGAAVKTMKLGRIRAVPEIRTQLATTIRFPIDIVQLMRTFHELKPDVVQLNGLINPHGAIAARMLGIPVVWQLLDTRVPPKPRYAAMLPVRALADVVMSTGWTVAEVHPGASKFGDRLVIFYPPVDTDRFKLGIEGKLRNELGLSRTTRVVGSVANVNPQKGHEVLIDAFSLVKKDVPNSVLVIAGALHATQTAYLHGLKDRAVSNGLVIGENVFFLGSRSDVQSILPDFDVFAMAPVPNSEGAPTAILEAMACGIPVVATNVASIPETVADGETGFLVHPFDSIELAQNVSKLLHSEELRNAMGSAARIRVEKEFSMDRCVEAHVQAYELAIRNRRGSS